MSEEIILETEELTKEFAGFMAVSGVNLRDRARHHPRADRAERRRQDHLLQSADQVSQADARPHPLSRARHHGARAGRCGAARPGPLVPDLGGVSPSDRARKCAHRAAAQARRIVRLLALEPRARRPQRPCARTDRRCRPRRLRRRTTAVELPYGRKRALELATTLALDPKCCCSTSRPPAWATRTSIASPRSSSAVAANRTVLMVEHNLSVVADAVRPHHRADARPHPRRGRLRDGVGEPGGARGLSGSGP